MMLGFKHKSEKKSKQTKLGYVLDKLHQDGFINEQQYAELGKLDPNDRFVSDKLIDKLREMNLVAPLEPLDENVEDFIQDLGAQNASDIASCVRNFRNEKRGLKDLTPVPYKNFPIPAPVVFAIIFGGALAVIAIAGSWDSVQKMFGGHGGGGGFKIPFLGGKFIDVLVTHIPWVAKLFL